MANKHLPNKHLHIEGREIRIKDSPTFLPKRES